MNKGSIDEQLRDTVIAFFNGDSVEDKGYYIIKSKGKNQAATTFSVFNKKCSLVVSYYKENDILILRDSNQYKKIATTFCQIWRRNNFKVSIPFFTNFIVYIGNTGILEKHSEGWLENRLKKEIGDKEKEQIAVILSLSDYEKNKRRKPSNDII